jgi:hypothetical protein
MSFLGTYSALSKNGYQTVQPTQWQLTDIKGPFISSGPAGQAFSGDGNYLAFAADGVTQIYYSSGLGNSYSLQSNVNSGFCSFNSDGTYLAVGDPTANSTQGVVYIYTRSGTTWTLQQTLSASDGAAGDRFGDSLSLSGNADYIAIGAPSDDIGAFTNMGSAYVFVRSGTSWTQQQKLQGDSQSQTNYASVLQISENGSYLIIGVPAFNGTPSPADMGQVFIYNRSGTVWSVQDILYGDLSFNARFGSGVNITSDGSLACIREQSTTRLYFYIRSGTTWTQSQILNYGAYTPIIINNAVFGTSMQNNGDNIIASLGTNYRVIAIDNETITQTYQIQQELFSDLGPALPVGYGRSIALAGNANVCAVSSTGLVGASNKIYIYIKT